MTKKPDLEKILKAISEPKEKKKPAPKLEKVLQAISNTKEETAPVYAPVEPHIDDKVENNRPGFLYSTLQYIMDLPGAGCIVPAVAAVTALSGYALLSSYAPAATNAAVLGGITGFIFSAKMTDTWKKNRIFYTAMGALGGFLGGPLGYGISSALGDVKETAANILTGGIFGGIMGSHFLMGIRFLLPKQYQP